MKVKLGCDGCIRRKTMFCPPSIECMSLDDLPYYLDKTSALEEIERLNKALLDIKEYIETNSYFESNIVKTMVFKDYSDSILDIVNKAIGSDKE